jgi:hypothetical protein
MEWACKGFQREEGMGRGIVHIIQRTDILWNLDVVALLHPAVPSFS